MKNLQILLGIACAIVPVSGSSTFTITPIFDSSITGSGSAANIEGSINSAISAFESLYTSPSVSPLAISITFTYNPVVGDDLLSTSESYYRVSYSSYVTALQADSTDNPANTALVSALANLSLGNDANGAEDLALTGALYSALGFGPASDSDATININSNQIFGFTPAPDVFDLTGGLEHEINEVLGGGGGGSTLNAIQQGACNPGSKLAFFCGKIGDLDPYRYSDADTPSFSTSASTSYFSIDGGTTNIVDFNQNSGGDYADFAPNCGSGSGSAQLIQNAFNCVGPDEAYTTSSPEFTMLESIGWDPTAGDAVPEPAALGLAGIGLAVLSFARRFQK